VRARQPEPPMSKPPERNEPAVERDHYSYTVYADPRTARTFDSRRFGGPIGDLVASAQADVLAGFLGSLTGRSILDVGTGTGRAAGRRSPASMRPRKCWPSRGSEPRPRG